MYILLGKVEEQVNTGLSFSKGLEEEKSMSAPAEITDYKTTSQRSVDATIKLQRSEKRVRYGVVVICIVGLILLMRIMI